MSSKRRVKGDNEKKMPKWQVKKTNRRHETLEQKEKESAMLRRSDSLYLVQHSLFLHPTANHSIGFN